MHFSFIALLLTLSLLQVRNLLLISEAIPLFGHHLNNFSVFQVWLLGLQLRTPFGLITEEGGHGLFGCILISLDTILLDLRFDIHWGNDFRGLFVVFSLGLGNFSDRSDFLGLSLGLVLGLLGHWGSSSLLIFLFDCHHYVFVCEY